MENVKNFASYRKYVRKNSAWKMHGNQNTRKCVFYGYLDPLMDTIRIYRNKILVKSLLIMHQLEYEIHTNGLPEFHIGR